MKRIISSTKNFILDILFPKFCLSCNREGKYLCEDCFSLIDISDRQYCPFCWPPKTVIDGKTCQFCRKKKKLTGLFSATDYNQAVVKNLIHQFKYPPYYIKELAKPLASLILAHFINIINSNIAINHNTLTINKADAINNRINIKKTKEGNSPDRGYFSPLLLSLLANTSLSADLSSLSSLPKSDSKDIIIIPVPLYKKKLKQRGYNQAEEIGKVLSEYLKIPIYNDILIKTKQTLSQADLNKKQRRKNIIGAFSIQNSEKIANKKILVIDDVFTTGTTMEECAQLLKLNKAKEVWGVVVARG